MRRAPRRHKRERRRRRGRGGLPGIGEPGLPERGLRFVAVTVGLRRDRADTRAVAVDDKAANRLPENGRGIPGEVAPSESRVTRTSAGGGGGTVTGRTVPVALYSRQRRAVGSSGSQAAVVRSPRNAPTGTISPVRMSPSQPVL
jgi:hypothetical protein